MVEVWRQLFMDCSHLLLKCNRSAVYRIVQKILKTSIFIFDAFSKTCLHSFLWSQLGQNAILILRSPSPQALHLGSNNITKSNILIQFESMNPISMLHFIQNLYQDYAVLNKISEKESNDFQKEIVVMLVDGDENVDQDAYSKHTKKGGIEGLILELLAKVMQRNPFKNQFQLNKNLALLTEKIKKDQEQLMKKQKILERKEQKIKNTEDSLISIIKTKINSLENEVFQKLGKKQIEIKKNVSTLINQLKSKQKLVIQKLQETKSKLKMLSDLENRQKIINQKLKTLQKRDKQLRTNNKDQLQQTKREAQIQQYKQTIERLKQNLKQSSKKYKNLQLAYRKVKNTQIKHQQMKKSLIPKLQIKQKEIINELDELQLSNIDIPIKNHCEQLINIMDFQDLSSKIQKISNIITKDQDNEDKITSIKQILGLQAIDQCEDHYKYALKEKQCEQSAQQDEQDQLLPKCLTVQPIQQYNSIKGIVKTIKSMSLEEDQQKLMFIQDNKLETLMKNCLTSKMSLEICETLLRKILELIQDSSHYEKIIKYLSKPNFQIFFEQVYLSHETNDEIIQAVTLVLSRIKLKDHVIELGNNFVKSLNMRLKIESKDSFLYGNITYLLSQL